MNRDELIDEVNYLYQDIEKLTAQLSKERADKERLAKDIQTLKAALYTIRDWDEETSDYFGDPGEYATHILSIISPKE